jgi:hypothetical protein
MGSLNNGQPINKDYNRKSIKQQGHRILSTNALGDAETVVSNAGTEKSVNNGLTGVAFGAATPKVEGMSLTERDADHSVERQKHTNDGTATGHLMHIVTRQHGKHVSVSTRHAYGPLEAARTVTERKVFSPDDWNVFNASGVAVGASAGTTDTDITPSGVS